MSATRRVAARRGAARLRARRGFTIVEMMLSLMLLSVGMLAMAGLLASSAKLQRHSASRAELTALAEAKIEELRSYGHTDSTNAMRANLALGGSLTSNQTGYADSLAGANNVMFVRRWQVAAGFAGARQVQVRVQARTAQRNYVPQLNLTSTVLLQ